MWPRKHRKDTRPNCALTPFTSNPQINDIKYRKEKKIPFLSCQHVKNNKASFSSKRRLCSGLSFRCKETRTCFYDLKRTDVVEKVTAVSLCLRLQYCQSCQFSRRRRIIHLIIFLGIYLCETIVPDPNVKCNATLYSPFSRNVKLQGA